MKYVLDVAKWECVRTGVSSNGREYRREYNQRGDLHYKDTFNVEFWANKERKVITPEQFSTP